jgi:hypothetical protein
MLATRARLSAALLATTAIVGCAKHPAPPSPLHAMPVTVLALPRDASEQLARSTTMTKPLRGVIRNATAWSVFWARARDDSAVAPTGLPPDVDFSREMLVVAGDGRRPSGYRIEIPGAARRNDTLFVLVRTREEGVAGPLGSLAPVAVVRVPRSDGPVVFRVDQSPLATSPRP